MSAPRTLVVGGTGPSGPLVVEGLLERGHEVAVLHTGRHEVEFSRDVEHIHVDPHFREPLEAALEDRTFDLSVCLYGRMRVVADVLRGRTERIMAVGGVFYPGWVDGRLLVRDGDESDVPPVEYSPSLPPVDEGVPLEVSGKFAERAVESERLLMEWHHRGEFRATMLRYPRLYGPRQLAPVEWSVVRRARDGRRRLLVPDGGLLMETRLFSENAARILLGAVDHPERSSGEIFNCGDGEALTLREWAATIAAAVGHEFELVSVPFDLAAPAYVYARYPWRIGHRILDVGKARRLLGYRPVPARVALARTARWYLEHPLGPGDGGEAQLGDPFDYRAEDAVADRLSEVASDVEELLGGSPSYRHPYDHPVGRTSGGPNGRPDA